MQTHATTVLLLLGCALGVSAWSPGQAVAATVGAGQPAQVRPQVVKKGPAAVARVRAGRRATLLSADERVRVKVEKGTLEPGARLSIQQVTGHDDPRIRSATYEVGPDGRGFRKPVEVCLTVPRRIVGQGDLCLGYFDEATGTWTCQDTCLTPYKSAVPRTLVLCGKTDHFTSFAVLDDGGGGKETCATTEEDLPMPIYWGGTGTSSSGK